MSPELQDQIQKVRREFATTLRVISTVGEGYPKLSNWLARNTRNSYLYGDVIKQARADGVADFDPDEIAPQQAQGESQAAPPGTKGATDTEVAAIAARIASYA